MLQPLSNKASRSERSEELHLKNSSNTLKKSNSYAQCNYSPVDSVILRNDGKLRKNTSSRHPSRKSLRRNSEPIYPSLLHSEEDGYFTAEENLDEEPRVRSESPYFGLPPIVWENIYKHLSEKLDPQKYKEKKFALASLTTQARKNPVIYSKTLPETLLSWERNLKLELANANEDSDSIKLKYAKILIKYVVHVELFPADIKQELFSAFMAIEKSLNIEQLLFIERHLVVPEDDVEQTNSANHIKSRLLAIPKLHYRFRSFRILQAINGIEHFHHEICAIALRRQKAPDSQKLDQFEELLYLSLSKIGDLSTHKTLVPLLNIFDLIAKVRTPAKHKFLIATNAIVGSLENKHAIHFREPLHAQFENFCEDDSLFKDEEIDQAVTLYLMNIIHHHSDSRMDYFEKWVECIKRSKFSDFVVYHSAYKASLFLSSLYSAEQIEPIVFFEACNSLLILLHPRGMSENVGLRYHLANCVTLLEPPLQLSAAVKIAPLLPVLDSDGITATEQALSLPIPYDPNSLIFFYKAISEFKSDVTADKYYRPLPIELRDSEEID